MFKNKNAEFWFWFILACANVFVIVVSGNNYDNFNVSLGICMMTLCVAKALMCAMEIDSDK